MTKLLLKNARVILPNESILASVLVSEGLIVGIESYRTTIQADKEVDLSEMTLLPGFIDVHLHGAVGVDVMEALPQDYESISHFLATQGITAWLPTLVPDSQDRYNHVSGAIEEVLSTHSDVDTSSERVPGAEILGVHYEGPFVNTAQCGALHAEHFKSYVRPADLNPLKTLKDPGAVKMITVAPEIEGGVKLVSELKRQGWIVSLGHTRADVELLDLAFSAGARHMTHFMNAMSPLHQRSPGPVGWGLSRDDVTCDFIADGIHLDPRVLRLLIKVKTPNCLILISDAIAATGQGDGDYQIWGEKISVTNRRTSNTKGNIAGSVITMLNAVRLMLSMGVSENDVARMASTNPAELIGVSHSRGSIEVGKRADLVALDRERNARLTIIGGQVAFSDL